MIILVDSETERHWALAKILGTSNHPYFLQEDTDTEEVMCPALGRPSLLPHSTIKAAPERIGSAFLFVPGIS